MTIVFIWEREEISFRFVLAKGYPANEHRASEEFCGVFFFHAFDSG